MNHDLYPRLAYEDEEAVIGRLRAYSGSKSPQSG